MRALLALLLLIGCGCSDSAAYAQKADVIFGLKLSGRVVDAADVLNADAEKRLARRAADLEATTTDQLVVVTIPTLEGRTIEQTGLRLANGWGIGREDLDNGVLILVAPNERKVRIDVGLGLEGLLTDERAAAIIKDMLPLFRKGEIAAAIELGSKEIETLLRSDRRRPQHRTQPVKKAA